MTARSPDEILADSQPGFRFAHPGYNLIQLSNSPTHTMRHHPCTLCAGPRLHAFCLLVVNNWIKIFRRLDYTRSRDELAILIANISRREGVTCRPTRISCPACAPCSQAPGLPAK